MKLKLLFFPIAVIVSLSLIIGFISPEFSNIKEKRNSLKLKERTLKDTIERKQNIISLTNSLDLNQEKEILIKNYLPSSKYEEEIINKVYKIAIDSKVSLIDLIFSNKGLKNKLPSAVRKEEIILEEEGEKMLVVEPKEMGVNVELLGTYENVRSFFSNVYAMEKFNNISSIDISKVGEKSGEEPEEASGSSNNLLKVTVNINFNYLAPISVNKNYSLEIFSRKNFDFSLADELEKMIVKKIPSVEVGATGKNNPFVP